ncbi:MAG: hypothetical protein QNJ00_15415 [Woeseiaceae bacterium]|nr:hypothetical protein [Woeseiaceae bacterium]
MKTVWSVSILVVVLSLVACSATSQSAFASTPRLEQSFNDTTFELKSCELKADRTAVCKMSVSNKYTDKRIEITGRGISIQDDQGNEYPVTSGGFGDPSTASKWNQVAVADSDYVVYVVATNLSTQATNIRAVVFPRLLVRSMQGQALGYRDRVVFSRPPMVVAATTAVVEAPPPVESAPPPVEAPPAAPSSDETMPIAIDEWQVVGLWSYDAVDGQQIPSQGYVLLPQAGAGVGQAWLARLELKNHDQLPARERALWPVMIHVEDRKVCADYPGYPSYRVFIDMPGIDEDAIYDVAGCKAE